MISQEEIDKFYKENYKNEKRGTSLNLNKSLFIDFQILCSELSRKSRKTITVSSTVRKLMVRFLIENKRN